jgi:hypothetical protein
VISGRPAGKIWTISPGLSYLRLIMSKKSGQIAELSHTSSTPEQFAATVSQLPVIIPRTEPQPGKSGTRRNATRSA